MRAALVLFSDPMLYPPTMNAASILVEQGYEVEVLGARYPTGDQIQPAAGVDVRYLARLCGGARLRFVYPGFCAALVARALRRKYDWVISYNMMGCLPGYLAAAASGAGWVYHNHDLTEVARRFGLYRVLKRFELWGSRRADAVAFPQRERAAIFARQARLQRPPLVVENGPRVSWARGAERDAELVALRARHGRVVLYQGVLSWQRGLARVVRSMPMWDPPGALCLVGGTEHQPGFPTEARALARDLGVDQRLMIRATVPYCDLPKLTRSCDVGVGVMATPEDDPCVNLQHLAGASNKLVEYMACGLPVVVPDTPEYRRYVGAPKTGVVVDPGDAASIARGINRLLGDDARLGRLSKNARSVFAKRLSYDRQFDQLLDFMRASANGRRRPA